MQHALKAILPQRLIAAAGAIEQAIGVDDKRVLILQLQVEAAKSLLIASAKDRARAHINVLKAIVLVVEQWQGVTRV